MNRWWIAGACALASIVAIMFLPWPFLWVFLGWSVFFANLALKGRGKAARLISFNLAAALLLMTIGELWFQVQVRRERSAWATGVRTVEELRARLEADPGNSGLSYRWDPDLGLMPMAEVSATVSRAHDGEPYFDVVYSVDAHGLRIAPPDDGATESLIFFGGSYTFGYGVEDDEAMPWLVGKNTGRRYRVYNFGVPAFGAQQMLARLKSGRVEKVVDHPPRHVFYLWIVNHVRRAAGHEIWSLGGPRYVLDPNGRVRYDGNFGDGADDDAVSRRTILSTILSRSALFDEIRRGTFGYAENARLLAAIVAASRDHIESVWPGTRFHVIFWDDSLSFKHAVMKAQFEEAGLSMIRVGDMLPGFSADEDSYWLHPSDRHPNPATYEQLADYLVREVVD